MLGHRSFQVAAMGLVADEHRNNAGVIAIAQRRRKRAGCKDALDVGAEVATCLQCADVTPALALGEHDERALKAIEDRIRGDIAHLGEHGSLKEMDLQALVAQRARPQTISASERDQAIERYQSRVHDQPGALPSP